ncbi:hypothetical protein MTBPR1_50128 [Candidatus Terasakiella magnetica]|uniref:Uncharacterized protein n=1 Tax=Candidatus Terasakiella magnetica TaxID=1867952 RepID=A0A1C3RJC3_9PROT|nr:hypothetical protein MTBPR1_50128 [Candidatus Terasakiella magnetica]
MTRGVSLYMLRRTSANGPRSGGDHLSLAHFIPVILGTKK